MYVLCNWTGIRFRRFGLFSGLNFHEKYLLTQFPFTSFSYPDLQIHVYAPGVFTHISFAAVHGELWHSSLSESHFSPVQPVSHIQPVTGSQVFAPTPQSQLLAQFTPYVSPLQAKRVDIRSLEELGHHLSFVKKAKKKVFQKLPWDTEKGNHVT